MPIQKVEKELLLQLFSEKTEDASPLSYLILDRLASEDGREQNVSSQDFYQAVRGASQALQSLNGRYHYLNRLHFKQSAKTLAFVADSLGVKYNQQALEQILNSPVDNQDQIWLEFLESFEGEPETRFDLSLSDFVGKPFQWTNNLFFRSASLFANGETPDMRIETLLKRVAEQLGQIQKPSKNEMLQHFKSHRQEITSLNVSLPASHDQAQKIAQSLLVNVENENFDLSDEQTKQKIKSLFYYLSAFGTTAMQSEAVEMLLLLEDGVYAKRQSRPLGQFPEELNSLDGTDSKEVLEFLNVFGVETDGQNGERALMVWNQAWQSAVTPEQISTDLDMTLYKHVGKGWGRESIELKEVLIAYAALVVKFRQPIPFVTHSVMRRLATISNHKNLALLRFVLFLRLPNDPAVTVEEIQSYEKGLTYESLTQAEQDVLEKFIQTGLDFSKLTRDEKRILITSMTSLTRQLKYYARAQKDTEFSRRRGILGDRVHIDDSGGNVLDQAKSGGKSIQIPREFVSDDSVVDDPKNSYALQTLEAISFLQSQKLGTLLDLGASVANWVRRLPHAEVEYENFANMALFGWFKYSKDLLLTKLRVWQALISRGKLADFYEEVKKLSDYLTPIRRRSLFRDYQSYQEVDVSEAFVYNSGVSTTTKDLGEIVQYVDVEKGEDNSLIIRGKSYDAQRAPVEGEKSRWSYLNIMRKSSSRALQIAPGDHDAFDHVVSHWGAQVLNDLDLELEVKGLENLNPDKVYIFAPTHASQLEFPLLFLVLRGFRIGFIAKKQVKYMPFLGKVMRNLQERFFFLDRKNLKNAKSLLGSVAETLGDENNLFSIVIYPEGTRSEVVYDAEGNRRDGPRLPLKKGAAHLALDSGVEIVPITINGVGRVFPKKGDLITNEKIEMIIGQPVDPKIFAGDRKSQVRQINANLTRFYQKHSPTERLARLSHPQWQPKKSVSHQPSSVAPPLPTVPGAMNFGLNSFSMGAPNSLVKFLPRGFR